MIRMILRGRFASESGGQLVEFSLVLPVLLLLIAGIAELGMLFQSYEVTTNVAREGARLAVLPGNEQNGYATVIARVNDYMASTGLPGTFTSNVVPQAVPITGGATANGVRVTVTYTYDALFIGRIAGFVNGTFADTITYQTTALMRTHVAAVAGP
ncbi:MAG: TadE/TadG family type IV pilus assembly protein [Vicinamibacterales bacterium]